MINKYLKEIYNEALPLKLAKRLTKGWDKTRHADWFNNKYRIYLPLIGGENTTDVNGGSELQDMIKEKLDNNGYELKDYVAGTVLNKKYNRVEKLGKVLNRLDANLFQQFQNDPDREKKAGKPIVVISRHPYDIAGMSTDRGWTSCKDLGTKSIYGKRQNEVGVNSKYVRDEVHCLLIAYLIEPDDKNIKNPIARVLMVPYMNVKGDIKYFVNKRVYGSSGRLEKIFINTVQHWLDSKQGEPNGLYKINPFAYNDAMPDEMDFSDDSEFPRWFVNAQKEDYDAFIDRNDNETLVWENGIWIDGTWEDGYWKRGEWRDGVWENGAWQNGIWIKGEWNNGQWNHGDWHEGIWRNGTFVNGTWHDGFWLNGMWKYGAWNDGDWENGDWHNGYWRNGIWRDGKWRYGVWVRGTWHKGIWKDGMWDGGIWIDGTWRKGWILDKDKKGNFTKDSIWKDNEYVYSTISPKDYFDKNFKGNINYEFKQREWSGGTWDSGTWEGGIFNNGKFVNCIWLDGEWKDGTWVNGTWLKGEWHRGTWVNGIWENGIWHHGRWSEGTWQNGTWKGGWWNGGTFENGIWESGIWNNGRWENGSWNGGWIYDPNKKGNFKKSWKWDGDYVKSDINPEKYFEVKKGKKK